MFAAPETSLVSVVIPCYGQAQFLKEAIESILSQTYRGIEVVVVDDGSPDNTAEIAAAYPVRYVRQSNRGVAEARNAGFKISRGEYVLFLDADDLLTPGAIESHLRCFAEHPEAGFVVGDIEYIDGSGQPIRRHPQALLRENHYEELLKVNHVCNTNAALFRRAVLEEIGGYQQFFSPAEDYELLLRAARAFPAAHHRAVVAHYRRHTTNASRQGLKMLKATQRVMASQRQAVEGNPRWEAALLKGECYWREWFGAVTIKGIYAHLRHGNLKAAAPALGGLLWHVRGRIFAIPWRYRHRALRAVTTRLRNLFSRRRKGMTHALPR